MNRHPLPLYDRDRLRQLVMAHRIKVQLQKKGKKERIILR